MVEPLLLPLRPPVVAGPTEGSLQVRIAQINKQKGAFRHVTEASLLEEINRDGQSDSDVDMESEGGGDALKPDDHQALIWKAREAMLRQIDHARNETLTALDFVSALLSKQVTAAQASMSPVLKEAVPIGSLEGRTVRHVPTPTTEQKKVGMIRRGWKMDSFASAAETISAAGSRMQQEAECECRYWDQIANLKARGWAVSRVPRDSRAVGVHFGFAEAAPTFRNRAFAVLRRDQNGNLSLDRTVIRPRPVAVVVTVFIDGQGSGSSTIQHTQATEGSPIEDHILQAHRTLSEEELFHEISREGRLLANHGVEVSTAVIKFDIGDKNNVQLRLINPENESLPANLNASAGKTANAVALSLRILLAHAHQQNLYRRLNAPPPMTLKAKGNPEYALLRPVMSHLQHDSHLDALRAFTASILPPLLNAGVSAGVRFDTLNHWNWPSILEVSSLRVSDLLQPLTAPLESMMLLELPTERSLELTVRTFFGPPVFGTEFSVKALKYGTKTLNPPRLETVTEIEDFVCHVLMMDIAMFIEALHITSGQAGTNDESGEASATLPTQPSWRLSDIHHGELSLRKLPRSIEKLQVRVWRDRLGLRHISDVKRASGNIVPYIWEAKKSWKTTSSGIQEEVSKQYLSEVVRATLQEIISNS